ncbi:hypothetical protein [Spirosoma luteum]|uniref:hypothetical protein n=1 Tax=Spirosoma luteum TaxID=431553 RepID=UPI00037BA686|nr:hypothetical protein [Spirosoma luteum]
MNSTKQTTRYRFRFLAESTRPRGQTYYYQGETFRRGHFFSNTDLFTLDEVRRFLAAGFVSNDITHVGVVQWDFPGSFSLERVVITETTEVEAVEVGELINEIEQ